MFLFARHSIITILKFGRLSRAPLTCLSEAKMVKIGWKKPSFRFNGKQIGFTLSLLGFTTKYKQENSVTRNRVLHVMKTQDDAVVMTKRRWIYEVVCVFFRALRIGATFLPIFLLYPITYISNFTDRIWWNLLLIGVESCGPIFAKLGQWVSTRHDIFPIACCQQFARLQRRAKCHSWSYTKYQFLQAFGQKWRQIFVKFDNNCEPIGSGCVAQVYKVWMSADHISDKDILNDVSITDDESEDSSYYFDGSEVLGFGRFFSRDNEQNESLNEFHRYREKRKTENLSDFSLRTNESIIKEDLCSTTTECETGSSERLKEKPLDHFMAEQWVDSSDSFEKSLPLETSETIEEDLDGLVTVAVKVLHPGMKKIFRRDMLILKCVVAMASSILTPLQWLSLNKCVNEFDSFLSSQIDMRREANNLDMFNEHFADVETVKFPRPIRPYVTNKILVETYEEGEPISEILSSPGQETLKQNLAGIGVDALLKMVFFDNFIHGDLHPGNVLVQNINSSTDDGNASKIVMVDVGSDVFVMDVVPDPNPLRICLLDCGVVASLAAAHTGKFKSVFREVIKGNGAAVAELFLEHSDHNCVDLNSFKEDMKTLISDAREDILSLEKVDIGQLLHDVLQLLIRHKIRLESAFSSVILSIIVSEGLGRALDPRIDILERAKSFIL